MVKGAPDHFKGVALYAWDGEELILIKVDPSGQLYALLMGDYGGTPTAIKVSQTGELYAALKAVYDSTMIDVLADVDGNLTLNLAAQDLSELINRPYYGAASLAEGTNVSCSPPFPTDLFAISGQGVGYGGKLWIDAAWNDDDMIALAIDNAPMGEYKISTIIEDGMDFTIPAYVSVIRHDTVTPRLVLLIPGGLTFETSFKLKFRAASTTRTVNIHYLYALV